VAWEKQGIAQNFTAKIYQATNSTANLMGKMMLVYVSFLTDLCPLTAGYSFSSQENAVNFNNT
jgi:hypothetical protein